MQSTASARRGSAATDRGKGPRNCDAAGSDGPSRTSAFLSETDLVAIGTPPNWWDVCGSVDIGGKADVADYCHIQKYKSHALMHNGARRLDKPTLAVVRFVSPFARPAGINKLGG